MSYEPGDEITFGKISDCCYAGVMDIDCDGLSGRCCKCKENCLALDEDDLDWDWFEEDELDKLDDDGGPSI